MKIELLSCSVVYFGNFCVSSVATHRAAPRRAAACDAQRAAVSASPGDSGAIQRIQGIRAYPQIAHDHGSSISGSEAAHTATTERNLRINACTRLHCGATPPPIATAKGQTRRPGARNRSVGDPAKEKKHPRNSSVWDQSREYSCRPQGMYELRM
jgi:hypothetical protein